MSLFGWTGCGRYFVGVPGMRADAARVPLVTCPHVPASDVHVINVLVVAVWEPAAAPPAPGDGRAVAPPLWLTAADDTVAVSHGSGALRCVPDAAAVLECGGPARPTISLLELREAVRAARAWLMQNARSHQHHRGAAAVADLVDVERAERDNRARLQVDWYNELAVGARLVRLTRFLAPRAARGCAVAAEVCAMVVAPLDAVLIPASAERRESAERVHRTACVDAAHRADEDAGVREDALATRARWLARQGAAAADDPAAVDAGTALALRMYGLDMLQSLAQAVARALDPLVDPPPAPPGDGEAATLTGVAAAERTARAAVEAAWDRELRAGWWTVHRAALRVAARRDAAAGQEHLTLAEHHMVGAHAHWAFATVAQFTEFLRAGLLPPLHGACLSAAEGADFRRRLCFRLHALAGETGLRREAEAAAVSTRPEAGKKRRR